MDRRFVRSLFLVAGLFIVFFAGELAVEWWRLGMPGPSATSWAGVNNAKLVDVMSPLARAYNNVLAMLIATIGLAIPLTANMHTPKLIEMFISDRLNQVVLVVMALLAANALWVAYMIGPEFAPTWAIRLAVVGALCGWAILIPYFFYVVRFLDPSNILIRLEREVERTIDAAAARRVDPDAGQRIVHERLHQIGTIVIKSLDRTDRGVALEGIWILKRLLDYHGARKHKLPAGWFVVDRADFVGLSQDALDLVAEEHLFFERKTLGQLLLAYEHALAKADDIVSSISDANRVAALAAAERGDDPALRLSIRYFNTFLADSVKRRNVHSVFDVFYQYRLLAMALATRAGLVVEMAKYLFAYAELARGAGLTFVPSFAVFDLASIALEAARMQADGADEVRDRVLAIPHERGGEVDSLVLDAKVKLGGSLLAIGKDESAAHVREALAGVAASDLRRAGEELLGAPHAFHEVTDRQVDLRWVRPERREGVRKFVESCVEGAPGGTVAPSTE